MLKYGKTWPARSFPWGWAAAVVAAGSLVVGCSDSGSEGGEEDPSTGTEDSASTEDGDGSETADSSDPGICTADEECDSGACDEAAGVCLTCAPGTTGCEAGGVATCLADGSGYGEASACDDGDPCTEDPACADGSCPPPVVLDCDDGDPCTSDFCLSKTGGCAHLPNQSAGCCTTADDCSDGLDCTEDSCLDGGVCENAGGPCASAEPVATFGEKGEADGQLSGPRGVTVAPNGNVYVADSGNNRVQIFDPDGNFVASFDGSDSPEGAFSNPSGLDFLLDGRLAVADSGNARVALFSADGAWQVSYDAGGDLVGPVDVAPTSDGTGIWVANSGESNVLLIAFSGEVALEVGGAGDADGKMRIPRGVLEANGTLFVADSDLDRLTAYDAATGDVIAVVGEEGGELGMLSFPSGIVRSQAGYVGVADPGNGRIQFFRTCVPSCDGQECGGNGCGGSCGQCFPEDTVCESGTCAFDNPGGAGCNPAGGGPGCAGCECEECVCAADGYCCETAWDDLCVGICVADCGFGCAAGEPELDPLLTVSSELLAGQSPTQIDLAPDGTLWIVDNISNTLTAYSIEP